MEDKNEYDGEAQPKKVTELMTRLELIRLGLKFDSQKEVADAIGVNYKNYNRYANGSTPNIGVEALEALRLRAKVDLNWLVCGLGDMFVEKVGTAESSGRYGLIIPPRMDTARSSLIGDILRMPNGDLVEMEYVVAQVKLRRALLDRIEKLEIEIERLKIKDN